MITTPELTDAAIRAAHGQIAPVFRDSPQYVHEGLSRRLGVPVIVKVETLNPIRSFNGRGTWVAVAALAGEGSPIEIDEAGLPVLDDGETWPLEVD